LHIAAAPQNNVIKYFGHPRLVHFNESDPIKLVA